MNNDKTYGEVALSSWEFNLCELQMLDTRLGNIGRVLAAEAACVYCDGQGFDLNDRDCDGCLGSGWANEPPASSAEVASRWMPLLAAVDDVVPLGINSVVAGEGACCLTCVAARHPKGSALAITNQDVTTAPSLWLAHRLAADEVAPVLTALALHGLDPAWEGPDVRIRVMLPG